MCRNDGIEDTHIQGKRERERRKHTWVGNPRYPTTIEFVEVSKDQPQTR